MIGLFAEFAQSSVGQALIIAAITALAAAILSPRGKLLWSVSHQHYYSMRDLQGGTFPVITQQVWFQNVGRRPIENIEVVLNWQPQHFEIWDPRKWEADLLPDGRQVITLPSLNAKEFFTISMIETIRPDLPRVLSVRWLGGTGKNVAMGPQRIFPMWFNAGGLIVLFTGVVAIIYFVLQMVLKFFPAMI